MTDERRKARDAARALYESGRMTIKMVAMEIGVSSRTVERWSAMDGWTRVQGSPELTERAQTIADKQAAILQQLGSDVPEETRAAALAEVTEDEAVAQRAEVIARHRQDWRIIGALIVEATKGRDPERGRLAETLARATKLKQEGERRAWALDSLGEGSNRIEVVIERE